MRKSRVTRDWSQRSSAGTLGAKKKKRAKGSAKKAPVTAEEPHCTSPLVYNPESALQELMEKHQKPSENGGLAELRTTYLSMGWRVRQVAVRMGLSNKISRFELPMDITVLENMHVQEYLRRFCLVSPRRGAHYTKSFQKFDKDKDGMLSCAEMECALKDIYHNEISAEQVEELRTLVFANEDTTFDCGLFVPLCALSERLFYTAFVKKKRKRYRSEEDHGNEREALDEPVDNIKPWPGPKVHVPFDVGASLYPDRAEKVAREEAFWSDCGPAEYHYIKGHQSARSVRIYH